MPLPLPLAHPGLVSDGLGGVGGLWEQRAIFALCSCAGAGVVSALRFLRQIIQFPQDSLLIGGGKVALAYCLLAPTIPGAGLVGLRSLHARGGEGRGATGQFLPSCSFVTPRARGRGFHGLPRVPRRHPGLVCDGAGGVGRLWNNWATSA
jgi:hypothetical protein